MSYIGDLGGQMWKWDIHTPGADSDSDGLLDWPAGVFFESEPVTFASGTVHYRSIFNSPAATFLAWLSSWSILFSIGFTKRAARPIPKPKASRPANRAY